MSQFWLIILYVLLALTLLAAVASWLRSLTLRDASSYVHHRVPARRIALGVAALLLVVLLATAWNGVALMFIRTIAVMLVVAIIAAVIGSSGILRRT